MHYIILFLLLLVLHPIPIQAQEIPVTFEWTLPDYYASQNNCELNGAPIPEDIKSTLQSQIRYHFGDGNWTYATTAITRFTIPITLGETITIEVGSFKPGGAVFCWTDPISHQVTTSTISPCTNILITNIK